MYHLMYYILDDTNGHKKNLAHKNFMIWCTSRWKMSSFEHQKFFQQNMIKMWLIFVSSCMDMYDFCNEQHDKGMHETISIWFVILLLASLRINVFYQLCLLHLIYFFPLGIHNFSFPWTVGYKIVHKSLKFV